LFRGGAQSAAEADPSRQTLALDAFVEGALKAVRSLLVSVPALGRSCCRDARWRSQACGSGSTPGSRASRPYAGCRDSLGSPRRRRRGRPYSPTAWRAGAGAIWCTRRVCVRPGARRSSTSWSLPPLQRAADWGSADAALRQPGNRNGGRAVRNPVSLGLFGRHQASEIDALAALTAGQLRRHEPAHAGDGNGCVIGENLARQQALPPILNASRLRPCEPTRRPLPGGERRRLDVAADHARQAPRATRDTLLSAVRRRMLVGALGQLPGEPIDVGSRREVLGHHG